MLSDLAVGKDAIVESLHLPIEVQQHLMYMGFVPDARVLVLRRAPAGDPTVYFVDGLEIALRRETAGRIAVRSEAARPDPAARPAAAERAGADGSTGSGRNR
jgi:Fe2+ transport system protein FeoA